MEKLIIPELEIWGGLECTINRVGDAYFDQLEYTGHWRRADDIPHFAALGIQKIRYPILWEHHEPEQGQPINWQPISCKIEQLREHDIEPIFGLLHHGSGPRFTHLLDPEFPEKFAAYALKVAQQFPFIRYYTPVNEPLTTARFSGLYGLWYPHSRDDLSFLQILINECKASVMAMKAIRRVNPNAVWLQTEDLGKTHSTPRLQYQADFENHRRWLGFDLLRAKLQPGHPLWSYAVNSGIDLKQLDFFAEAKLQPDLIGFNYYVTSERYLDESLERHPPSTHGGNGKHNYADVEAVRARPAGLVGLYALLKEAWQYLEQPMVLSEVHLHCHPEEQLRWFYQAYTCCRSLQSEGIPIQALTTWALIGAYGWDKLLSSARGNYESGVFDCSSGTLRPVELAAFITQLTASSEHYHPVLTQAGWWQAKLDPTPENICAR